MLTGVIGLGTEISGNMDPFREFIRYGSAVFQSLLSSLNKYPERECSRMEISPGIDTFLVVMILKGKKGDIRKVEVEVDNERVIGIKEVR